MLVARVLASFLQRFAGDVEGPTVVSGWRDADAWDGVGLNDDLFDAVPGSRTFLQPSPLPTPHDQPAVLCRFVVIRGRAVAVLHDSGTVLRADGLTADLVAAYGASGRDVVATTHAVLGDVAGAARRELARR